MQQMDGSEMDDTERRDQLSARTVQSHAESQGVVMVDEFEPRFPSQTIETHCYRQKLTDFALGEGSLVESAPGFRRAITGDLRSVFPGETLVGVDLKRTQFVSAVFVGSMVRVDLSESTLRACRFIDVIASELTADCIDATCVDFSGCRIIESSLRQSSFARANLRGCDFTGSNLYGSRLIGVDAEGANFSGADLTHCDFTGANLRGTTFDDSILNKTNLTYADLSGATIDLRSERLKSNFERESNTWRARLPEPECRLSLPGQPPSPRQLVRWAFLRALPRKCVVYLYYPALKRDARRPLHTQKRDPNFDSLVAVPR